LEFSPERTAESYGRTVEEYFTLGGDIDLVAE
jgi:hypothetical protein